MVLVSAVTLSMCLLAGVEASAGAPAGPSLSQRFSARAYLQGTHRVEVNAALDALALRTNPDRSPQDVARAVEAAATRVTEASKDVVLMAGSRRLRDHGLFLVELGAPVSHATLVALAEELLAVHAVDAVYPVLTRVTGRAFSDERLVVTAARGQLDRVLPAVLQKTGGSLIRRSMVPDTALIAVGSVFARDAVEASLRLGAMDGLLSAEPDLYREYELTATVNDPLHANQWHLHREAADVPVPGTAQIYAHEAWDVTKGSTDVIVAVFDSGVDLLHEDLVENLVPGFDPSAGDEDPTAECSSSSDGRGAAAGCPANKPYRESHGTAVSGVIAARGDNGIGLSGVCPRCKIRPVRLLGDQVGAGLSTAEAFIRAVNDGAWVINNSWGPGRSRYFPMSMAERAAFEHARTTGRGGLGTVIVFAAGNDTANVASDPYASHPFTVAVAASSNLDDWAPYSNYGHEISVAAPSLGSTNAQDNHGLWTTDYTGDNGYTADSYTGEFSGTSGASPVVAGVAGLILSVNRDLTAEQVRLVLTRTADKIVADKIDWPNVIGEDIATVFAYDATGHSIGFGYGRVNAQKAVALAPNPGLQGALCSAPGCPACSTDMRCELPCTTQADCVDGAVCKDGGCHNPALTAGSVGSPCSALCDHCTTTLDSESHVVSICTETCVRDSDCPTGFDCRSADANGDHVCGVGARTAGERDNIFNCFSSLWNVTLVSTNSGGDAFCTDTCFNDDPGSCPTGFSCAPALCACAVAGQNPCRRYSCESTTPNRSNWETDLCFPGDGYGVQCTTHDQCPPGDYCTPAGSCRADDRAGCSVCRTCTNDADCGVETVCVFTSFQNPTGVCTRTCNENMACPGDSVCRAMQRRSSSINVCLSPSDVPTVVCARGYECKVPCRDDVTCGAGETCDNGVCVVSPLALPPPDPPLPEPDTSRKGFFGFTGCSSAGPDGVLWMVLGGAWLALRRRPSR